MKYELGDHSFVRCPEMGLVADLEFKTKGWVGGTYNAIGGTIRNEKTGEILYEFSGLWSDEMYIKNVKVNHRILDLRSAVYLLTTRRLVIRSCSSTRTVRGHHRHKFDPLRSKKRENRRSCGKKPHKPSGRRTTRSLQRRKPRLKTCNETRLPSVPKTVSSGIRGYSEGSKVALVVPRKVRKISSG